MNESYKVDWRVLNSDFIKYLPSQISIIDTATPQKKLKYVGWIQLLIY